MDNPETTLQTISRPTSCGSPECRLAFIDLRAQARYWQTQFQRCKKRETKLKAQRAQTAHDFTLRLCQRENQLQQQIEHLEAEVRLLKQRLYGHKNEGHHQPNTLAGTPATTSDAAAGTPAPKRSRGHQRGRPGHKRRTYDHLPAVHETALLSPEQCQCATCGLPFASCGSEPDLTTLLEVSVRAHRRVIRRRRYRPTCACQGNPTIIAAPPPRLIPQCLLGVSVWVLVLLDKYAFHRPTSRLVNQLRSAGLDLAVGTLTDGLQRLVPLLEPVYEALRLHNQKQEHWHGDETRWRVFVSTEGKVGYLWYLWLMMSQEAAVFVVASGRSHDVPEGTLGKKATGIFSVDRYSAYPAMKQVKDGQITLAFCWAHQRRDFIEVQRGHPHLQAWTSAWLDKIGELYRLNAARVQLDKGDPAFAAADGQVRAVVAAMAQRCAEEQAQAKLPAPCRKVLASMATYWSGLTVFVDHPEVPLDNNAAERAERGPVVGRKNYYGSGALWSGQLAAIMFSILETLRLWDLDGQLWLTGYLEACVAQGGRALSDVRRWLPWRMTEAERTALRLPASKAASASQDSS